MKHTATPWTVSDQLGIMAHSYPVAQTCEVPQGEPDERKANAELIAEAVNNHADLLDVCQQAHDLMQAFCHSDGTYGKIEPGHMRMLLNQCKQTLNKINGKVDPDVFELR